MSVIKERVVKRYYVNGKGYPNKAAAYRAMARRELLDEFIAEHGSFTSDSEDGKGPAYHAMTEKYTKHRRCSTCGGTGSHPYGDPCGCDAGWDGEYFDSDEWHADIDKRAAKIAARED